MLEDKVAIVTGGTRGIGRAIVLRLARSGCDVAFTYLKSSQEADLLIREAGKLGRRVLALQADVRDFDQSRQLIERVKDDFGKLDILVNNAGITRDKALMMMTREEWLEVVDTNLNGTFNATRCAIVTFLKQKSGSIVNITSVSGVTGLPRQTNYSASKAGIIGFTKALAREVAAYNIRVNAVAPGFIDTDMIGSLKEEFREAIRKRIPLARFGSADDVSRVVEFMASDRASFITGQVVIVDGGLSIQ
ncbi:MAG: 3-oxoacyl-[acyl-carrier-protein] reductase [Candidatus Omnitrophica bacterium]|nr:3-oxoacyl-[acyl-carrier-protein] reductase [Candidatus Omnitrophota bacterium]